MEVKKIIRNEYVFAIFTRVMYAGLGLLAAILIARYLGSDLKGQVAYVQSVVATTSIVFGLGIHHAYPFFRKKEGSVYKLKFMGPVTRLILLYIICSFAIAIFINDDIITYSALLTPLYVFTTIVSYVLLVENPNKVNGSKTIFVFTQCLIILMCMLTIKRNMLIGVGLVCIPELFLALYAICATNWKFEIKKSDCNQLKELIKYGFLPMIALLLTNLNYRIDVLMLNGFSEVQYSQIGVYSIGITMAEKALLISDAAKEILLSKLSKGKGEEEVAQVMRLCFPIAIIFAFIIIILGKPLIGIMFGDEYKGAYLVTSINLIGTIFMVFFKMITQYNIVNNRQLYNIIFLSASVFINVVLNFILIPQYGIYGAALASTIGYIISAIIYLFYFSKISKIRLNRLVFINKEDIIKIKKYINRKKTL